MWGSFLLAPADMFASMALVALPAALSPPNAVYADAEKIQNWLYDRRVEVPIKVNWLQACDRC